ncbi:hypothetical protein [Arthrobacter sp. HLT1-21]
MAVAPATVKALATYVQASETDQYVIDCADEAVAMVARPVSKVPADTVPASAVARAVLEAGAELYHRRQSRNGLVGLDSPEFAPMRIARDPMKAAMPFLQPYLGPAVA